MKKKKNKIGKVNPMFYALVRLFIGLKFRLRYRLTVDRRAIAGVRGPALVLAAHVCDQDHWIAGLTLYPIRPTFVVSEHFTRFPKTKKLLELMHVITKKMYCPDAGSILNILRAKKEGNVVVMFPEGRLSCYGHSLPVTPGTAELAKKFGTDLYVLVNNGGYLSFPKWRAKGSDRRGKIHSSVQKIATAEEVSSLSVEQIRARIEAAICHDDEKAMAGVRYKTKDTAAGLDGILYVCPACKKTGSLHGKTGHIQCAFCGFDALLDEYYRLHGAPFSSINEWFLHQQNSLDLAAGLSSEVCIGAVGEDGLMNETAGTGRISITPEAFCLEGTVFGKEISFTLLPEQIGAFPITVGKHFDVYYHNDLYYLYPMPDPRASVLWVSYLDRLTEEKRLLAQAH